LAVFSFSLFRNTRYASRDTIYDTGYQQTNEPSNHSQESSIQDREYSYLRAYKALRQLSGILYKSDLFLQNKANFKIGKMSASIATIKDYDKKQRTINNERYSKQSQSKPILHQADKIALKIYPFGIDCPIVLRQNRF